MGLFCVNMHFRTTDEDALSASLERRDVTRYRVVPAKNGWTSLYEERASDQDDERIRDLAGGLSSDLHVAAIAFLVHDSDVACYWLFDDGQLVDEYNSCPHYFDDEVPADGTPSAAGGRPDVLLRYCRSGVQAEELASILGMETVFAEAVIERLAGALGIDVQRALTDYRDADDQGPHGFDGFDEDDDDDGGGPTAFPPRADLTSRLAEMLGADPQAAHADPQATALVQAAADGQTDEIDRLLAAGAAVDVEAPAPLAGGQPLAALGKMLPGGVPKIPMTPLLAAIAHKQHSAVQRLLEGGADPNRVHALMGTPVHAAAAAGDAELLKVLLSHAGDVNARNIAGQTPLQIVAAGRTTLERLAQAQSMMESMGVKLPGIGEQLSSVKLPTEGWDACERLLKEHGAQ
jgi:hypothetical protein